MNKLRTTSAFKVRRAPRAISGNNDRGSYAFKVVEVLDQDDNKHEITLPDQYPPGVEAGAFITCDLDIQVRKGYLAITAVAGSVQVKSPAPVASVKAG